MSVIGTVFAVAMLAVAGALHAITTYLAVEKLIAPPENPGMGTTATRCVVVVMIITLWAMMLMAVWVLLYKGG